MAEQIRGIILEGQSCSGKTSIFNALKRLHTAQPNAERNVIFLSEHYSQNLNWVHGQMQCLTREENLQVLSNRVGMLEQLSSYADGMGVHSRRSRGLFFMFERFHLNFAYSFPDADDVEYQALEARLSALHPLTVLCTVSPDKVHSRLVHRATYTGENVTDEAVQTYIQNQQRFIKAAERSTLPTLILCTDGMDWDGLARQLLERIQ